MKPAGIVLGLVVALTAGASYAQQRPSPVLGRWLTEGKDGVIEIFPCADGALCGRLTWFAPGPDDVGKPPVDAHNPAPALRGRPLCGLVILRGFMPSGDRAWGDGSIYDPENGKIYHATMALAADDTLRLRGYIGVPLLGETQL